jgi:hypothetical protein
MTANYNYFRALASRCRTDARQCFDMFAQEEFCRLAHEFDCRAEELDHPSGGDRLTNWWRGQGQTQAMGRDR